MVYPGPGALVRRLDPLWSAAPLTGASLTHARVARVAARSPPVPPFSRLPDNVSLPGPGPPARARHTVSTHNERRHSRLKPVLHKHIVTQYASPLRTPTLPLWLFGQPGREGQVSGNRRSRCTRNTLWYGIHMILPSDAWNAHQDPEPKSAQAEPAVSKEAVQHLNTLSIALDEQRLGAGLPIAGGPGEVLRAALDALVSRPEPVVAPLPSEAVEAALEASRETPTEVASTSPETWMQNILLAALPHLRLVPEDHEDTVRVPREAVERLHPRGTISVPVFDEFDSPTRDGCTTCRQSWPCQTVRLLGGAR